ncbi:hypothetical protein [Microbacterium pumilum]|uniref:hypothetical protein n=1 Tax=Microbacterium pumilum TaxID=344165 RepID=UPI0031CEF68C
MDLDVNEIDRDRPEPDALAEYIARLALADIFLVILCEEYLPSGGGMRAWLFEEWSRIERMRDWGIAEVIAVHRSGSLEDDVNPFVRLSGTLDAVIDLREEPDDFSPVVEIFGRWSGRKLPESRAREIANAAHAVIAAARAKRWDDCETAFVDLSQLPDIESTEEYWLASVWRNAFRDDDDVLRDALARLIEMNPGIPSTQSAATALWLADRETAAFWHFAGLSETRSLWRGWAHHVMGEFFRTRGAWLAAHNHLSFAADLIERQSGQPDGVGDRDMADALAEHIEKSGYVIARGCEHCKAKFIAGRVCVLCGVQDTRAESDECSFCSHPLVELDECPFCPICRSGVRGSPFEGGNVQIVTREVGGRYSLLSGT